MLLYIIFSFVYATRTTGSGCTDVQCSLIVTGDALFIAFLQYSFDSKFETI